MLPLTVIIPCYNEEAHMKDLLESVKWADEILIVDSFSTDKSLEIAREYTDRILQRSYENSANQKNWTIPQAKHEWILLVDADERVTPALQKEVQGILANQGEEVAYWINRQNYFMGQQIRYCGWQNDSVIRLFKKSSCKYEEKQVHAEIIAQGKVGKLQEKLVHYTFRNSDHFLQKMERYAAWSAQDYAQKTKRVGWYHLSVKPAFRFFKHFILKLGFLDGKVGFIISVLMAWGVFLRYFKLKETQTKK